MKLTLREARDELAKRIKYHRAVSVKNDPNRTYRKRANECRKGNCSYNSTFGIGKVPKVPHQPDDTVSNRGANIHEND